MLYDIVAIGESLIDFVSRPCEKTGSLLFEGNPGGAPANVLAGAAKLGMHTAFIGKVGKDVFGECLKAAISGGGVDCSAMVESAGDPTTLAFVSLDPTGNRSFSFYRKHTADVELTESEVDYDKIAHTKLFHFGSVSLTSEPARSATMAAVRRAAELGVTVSYDPNLRERLWDSLEEARQVILEAMSYADIVKLSEEELTFLTGMEEMEPAMHRLYADYDLKFLAVTLGPKGCKCLCGPHLVTAPTYDTACIDTTGAGDSFWGAMLSRVIVCGKPFEAYTEADLRGFMDFSNAAGSLTTTKKGAIPAMPGEPEIRECMANIPYLK